MQAKSERFELRLDPTMVDRLDAWRSAQSDLPSRAEAVRRLAEVGLSPEKRTHDLSMGEKLIIFMLGDIHQHLKIKGEIDASFVASALVGGHIWAIERKYFGLTGAENVPQSTVSEVIDILDMWRFIETAFAALPKKERQALKDESVTASFEFHGFDGNNESEHRHTALFMIEEMDLFSAFKGRDLNTHSPVINRYRGMLSAFNPLRASLVGKELGAAQLRAIFKAARR